MNIYPAIDILDGKVVRLDQGSFDAVTNYADDPISVALQFKDNGAQWLHIIDLDAAKSGDNNSLPLIRQIIEETKMKIQVGGGIRSFETAQGLFDIGVNRVIIGTIAVKKPDVLREMIKSFGNEKVVVSVDFRDKNISTDGWLEESSISPDEFAQILLDIGVKTIIVTDISRDGRQTGSNNKLVQEWQDYGFAVIAAGGVASLGDIASLKANNAEGAIVGKAIYENSLNLNELFEMQSRNGLAKRVIACLDVKDGRVVKGTGFKDFIEMGDPLELAKYYSEQSADELILLDIAATVEARKNRVKLVETLSATINIPFTIGGGISTTKDINDLLSAGADKVSIGSAAILDANFVQSAVEQFGAQAIVVSIDVKQDGNSWKVAIKGGAEMTEVDAIEFAEQMAELGVGELLVNSLDRDGTGLGFDIRLLNTISRAVNVPVIASSGAGRVDHFSEVFQKTKVTAALAARLFHSRQITIRCVKENLKEKGITVRL